MRKSTFRFALMATAAFSLSAIGLSATAQEGDTLGSDRAQIVRGNLTNASVNAPGQIAQFINERRGRSLSAGAELTLTGEHVGRNGVRHMRFAQEIDGLRVHGAYARAAIDGSGNVTHLIERTTASNGRRVGAAISASEAVSAAISHHFGEVSADFFYAAPRAEKVLIARRNGQLDEGYLVETWSDADNQLYETLIGPNGRVVSSELRTANDTYNVFRDHPNVTPQAIEQGAGSGNAESPVGWLSGPQTSLVIRGNNVSAYLDRDANNVIDGGGRTITDGNFVTNHLPFQSATVADNQEVAVQNLFYLNNIIHDSLYRNGFTESVGNFQEDNFGRGGAGSDSVNAEAQDGSGTNNANFATPGDGSNPRMQMFLWTLTNPGRDGDLDSDIVWHEYGHGLTWRMIGSMSGSVSGAIGEGMSDVLAILNNGRDTVGEYSTNDPEGIRSAAYTNYPRTIGDFTGSSVHFDGEIYAATIWRLSEIANAAGIDNQGVLDVLVDGMNFTPAGPDYLDMRDGILAASSGDFTCMVWDAFSDYGMGEGASFNIRTGGNPRNRIQISESFTVPAACTGGSPPPPPPPPPPGAFSVDGLTGSASSSGRNRWSATATVSVIDENTAAASGVTMSGSWSNGSSGSCTTAAAGTCSVTLGGLRNNRDASVTFTVDTLDGAAATGSPLSVTINRP